MRISAIDGPSFQERKKESLDDVLRIVMTRAAAPHMSVERSPVTLKKIRKLPLRARRRVGMRRVHDHAPVCFFKHLS